MEKIPVPFIAQADFPAFKAILKGDLPGDTWDEWFQRNKQYAADLEKKGECVQPIPADPQEFSVYLNQTGQRGDLNSFGRYLQDKAAAHDY